MMSVETMRSVNPKTVDRSTLVQRDSIRLLEDRHHLGGLSGTLSERTLIMNKLNLFARFYGQAIEPVIQ